jgi:hypothetical protein
VARYKFTRPCRSPGLTTAPTVTVGWVIIKLPTEHTRTSIAAKQTYSEPQQEVAASVTALCLHTSPQTRSWTVGVTTEKWRVVALSSTCPHLMRNRPHGRSPLARGCWNMGTGPSSGGGTSGCGHLGLVHSLGLGLGERPWAGHGAFLLTAGGRMTPTGNWHALTADSDPPSVDTSRKSNSKESTVPLAENGATCLQGPSGQVTQQA